MLADFLSVIPQIPALVLITYSTRVPRTADPVSGAQTIGLRPLNDADKDRRLAAELLGPDSVAGRNSPPGVGERAGGNPFFAEEMVRDLCGARSARRGSPGAYTLRGDVNDVDVPATLHATIGARIDRLERHGETDAERGSGDRLAIRCRSCWPRWSTTPMSHR